MAQMEEEIRTIPRGQWNEEERGGGQDRFVHVLDGIQEDREPVDEFITPLYKLADSCEFEGLHEQLIRDRIVVGERDKALSERMQLDSELTLEKAVKMVRQQQVDLQRPSTSQKVNQVKFNSKKQSPEQQQQPSRKKEKSQPKQDHDVQNAEVSPTGKDRLAVLKDKDVSAVEDSSNLDDDEGECRRRWTAEIQVNGKQVKFKLHSQADVTCVPLCLFKKIMGQQRLVESDINITATEFSELQTVGMFISTLRNGNYEIKENIYVIRRLSEPLLSRRACELLNLARRIEVIATRINPIKEFPEVFEGLGQIGNPYKIKLKPGAKPYDVHTPRRVPIPLMEKLKTRLEALEKAGIIAQVNVATEWCAPTVIAGKPNGDIRLCVDLSRLNEHVQREVHPMPVVEHMLGQLGEARFFSKLEANSGFHQIPLSPDCQHLTTFITPFGRYKFFRMPFGISLAPEYFQKVMSIILQGMDGVMCYLDDILIFASDSKTHARILRLVIRKLEEAKVTLNKAKCVFGLPRINFLGHILDEDGIRPDPAKIEAVAKIPAPTDVHGVRRFLGMVNHLGRLVENISEIAAPPNQLLVKAYDVRKPTMVSSDAFSYGLGVVLKQEGKNGIWRPVAYSSRTMTPTEKRYAQIEKEALAITWACELFQEFLLGNRFRIETDHEPLSPLFSTKELSSLTPRQQRFRMRMMRFGFEILHIPGKELLDADALSRQSLLTTEGGENERPTSAHINAVLACITDKDEMLTKIFEAQQEDTTLKAVVNYLEQGWPDKKNMSQALLSYWHVKDELGVQNGLLMRSCRLVIPASMKLESLDKLHAGHFGITKTRLHARETVWWPGILEEIAETVRKCSVCIQEAVSKHEPLIPTNFPTRPWQKIGMDLFKFENKWYLVVIDYYSRFPEMIQLDRLTANVVVRSCKSIFARHVISETVVSDNGTQFGAALEFANFARQYGFTHATSSPRFPQSNGMAEAGVKIAKLILKKNLDPSLGLLEYRSTPLENGYRPAELLIGRKLRTTLPIAPENLNPRLVDSQTLKRKEGRRREDMKSRYDRRRGATDMEELSEGTSPKWRSRQDRSSRILRIKRTFSGLYTKPCQDSSTLGHPEEKYSILMWSDKCEEAYLKLNDIITSKPILAIPDESLPYEMSTDASYYGTGAILYQRDVNKRSFYATFLVEIPGKSKTALRRSFRLQGLQPQYGFEDLPSSTRMVKTEASGTPEVFGTNAGPQSYACHIPRNPPTFSGESAQDPQRWIKMFERVAKYNKWDETQSLANVVFYLEGTAAQWFDNNEDIIDSWTQFKTNLCEVFGKKEELTRQAEMTLKTRAQKPGETTESCIQEILSLCSRVNPEMEEEEKVGHLMKGIAEDFYQTLIVKDPTTVDELVKFCRQLENMKQRRIKRTRYERLPNVTPISSDFEEDLALKIRRIVQEELQKIMPKMTEVEPFGTSDVNSLEAIVKEEVQQVLAPITRRNIQSQRRRTFVPRFRREDDYTPYAPRTSDQWRTVDNQPICFHCGKPGHVLRYCRERRRTFEEARSRRTLPSADNATPQRPYDLNDDFPTLPRPGGFGRSASPYPGRGRMPRRRSQSPGADSGADYSVVSEKFRRLLRTPFFVESGPVVKVANGKLVKTLGKCSLKVHINDLTTTFEFIEIPDCSHDIILGWDFFKATRAVIDCGHQELYLEETLPINDDQINLDVYSADNYVIPPKSSCKISVVGTPIQENRDVLICPNWELSIRKEFIIPSLLTTFQQGKADLWIANGNSKPLMIPSRMALGTMSDVDVGSICSLKCDELIQEEEMWTTKLDQKIEAMIDSNLTEDQQNKMINVIKKFSNVFDFSGKSQPARSKIKHKIDTGDHAPTEQRPYRVSGMERKIIQQEVDRMFCVDYRRLNKITKKDVYPLPRVDDALDNLPGARYYSSMDLRTGYWQIEVDEHDREKTAFITPDGLYQFRVMPFGLCNAPATFERMMDTVLKGLKWNICLCYLDDIVVSGPSFEEHIKRLEVVLECLQQAGLNVNNEKCLFGSRRLKILGHVVNENGIHPDPEKVEAILKFPSPKSIPDVRSFLGLCSYYRRFVENFSCKAKPLNDLLKNDAKFCWNKEQENAFEILKEALTSEPVLGHFIEDAETHIHTDASGYGIGAVLIQIQGSAERPIAYASRTLAKAENNYSTTEKELLAVVWATFCGINHLKTTAYHPQTNGLTERLNKTLTDMLSMYVDAEQKNWDEVLPFVTFAYNTAKQETTGFSPFFLVHGREAETTLDSLLPYHDNDDVGDYVQHLITTAEEARHLAQLHLYRGQEKNRKYYDRKHRPVDYNVGDLVWLFIPVRKVGLSEKLIKKYFGPYRITRKLSPVNYEIEAISDFPRRRKTRDTVHVLRMKPYLDPLLQEEISGSTPNKEPVLKQRFSDPEPISGPVTRSRARRMQI
ncbi:K02A2.6-like, partial [Cordylochernes scorpioides]